MFDTLFGGPPEDWEPIPDDVQAELDDLRREETPGYSPLPADGSVLVVAAAEQPLGPQTFGLLTAAPVSQLDEAMRSHALRRATEFAATIESLRVELTAAIAGPEPASNADRLDDYSAQEVGVATRRSVYAADRDIGFARDLTDRLCATQEALAAGRITPLQAKALSEATRHLDVEIAREIETGLLKFSHRQDLELFRQSLRRWLAKKDPDWADRARQARADAEVSHTANDDGIGAFVARGPLEITTGVSMALTAYAAKTRETLGGTADQRKLAGLRDMAERYLDSDECPKRHGRTPEVHVTIDLATLLGLRAGVSEIPGVGPIPADAALWLLADGAPLRRLVTDPESGSLIDYGTTTYAVPPDLADKLIARYLHSASPHSQVAAAGADLEHNTPHDHGGPTNEINVTPMDRRWHRAKTHGGWRYVKDPNRHTVTWTSPTSGLTCTIEPYDYRAGP
jgi:hypothetical protein